MAQGSKYPLPKFHFVVEWNGTTLGFTEVTGLDIKTPGCRTPGNQKEN